MVDISAGCRPLYRPRYLPIVGRYVDHHSADIHRSICRPTHLGRHIDRLSTDMSTDISTDTRPICRPIHRSTVGRYVGRYIGRGVHKIHMILCTNTMGSSSHNKTLSCNAVTKGFSRPTSHPVQGWMGNNKVFCSHGTRDGRRVIKVYSIKWWCRGESWAFHSNK